MCQTKPENNGEFMQETLLAYAASHRKLRDELVVVNLVSMDLIDERNTIAVRADKLAAEVKRLKGLNTSLKCRLTQATTKCKKK